MFGLTPYERRNAIGYYNPFKELEDFEKKFFSSTVPSFADFKTDIRDDGKNYILESELPGFDRNDINIDINNGILTVSAERNSTTDEKNKEGNYIRRERSYGTYSRSFDVSGIDENNITASFNNGILELILPKKEEKKNEARKIEIM